PGDIVVADVDGVVIVPHEMAEDVARDATEQEQLEIFISQRIDVARHHAVDMNVPIACGGVAVYPGDIVVADVDGVVIVPHEMAEDVARDATEQEQLEIFISQRIDEGRPLRGTYPPNEETLAAYAQWRAQK
ncbi:RraA family protein, partial [Caballeronia sp. M23-90]